MTSLSEYFGNALVKSGSLTFDSTVFADPSALREVVLSVSKTVGYDISGQKGGADKRSVLIHEYRHVPYLMHQRAPKACPLIVFDFINSSVQLSILGPLTSTRVCPYFTIEITFSKVMDEGRENYSFNEVDTVVESLAVGVHTWERFLRSPDVEVHQGLGSVDARMANHWNRRLKDNVQRALLARWLFQHMQSAVLYVGHDCYDQAIDVNAALSLGIPVLMLPKGKLNQIYSREDRPGYWNKERSVFFSHLYAWFRTKLNREWMSVESDSLSEAVASIESRITDLSTLRYMQINAETYQGYEIFKKKSRLTDYQPDLCDGHSVAWLFSLHSFSDEACRWGMDRLNSLYVLFMTAAQVILSEHPDDMLVLRPHPNCYRFFSEGLIDRIERGELSELATQHFDIYLQFRLCRDIAALSRNVRLSGPSPISEALEYKNTVVFTRHGSIVIEAAWLGRSSVFSVIAPYGFLFPESLQFGTENELICALAAARVNTLNERNVFPSKKDLARYVAIHGTPQGLERGKKGKLPHPVSRAVDVKTFDDFTYPERSVAATLDGVLSCYQTEQEKSLFRLIAGLEA